MSDNNSKNTKIVGDIDMKQLPEWLQKLWELSPMLARQAEKDYLKLLQRANEANTGDSGLHLQRVSVNEVAVCEDCAHWMKGKKLDICRRCFGNSHFVEQTER